MSVIAAIQQMSQAELPDALDVLHQRYGRYALNEFLRETEAYRTTVKITLDGRDSYTLSLPYGTSPLHIKSVFRDDHRLTLSGDPAKVRLDGRKLLVDPTLTGVLASSIPERSIAIVLNGGDEQGYSEGDVVNGTQAIINSIQKDRILLDNQGQEETLMLDGEEYTPSPSGLLD